MVLFWVQRVCRVLEYQHLERSCVQTKRSFQRIFLVRICPLDNAIKALFEMLERKGNVYDDRNGNVCQPRSAVTESNADAVQLVFRQRPRTYVRSIFGGKNHIIFIC
ncbi:hypothetical protein AVEN_203889-1 [Araneus ventricosus]|uniref:Uncharacterized protein n=1 Tax=Araneus ventricosus TaxID=182803 RepID=A0A4Y2TWT7_ARAVE|nr:hypothetical protein AVEN_203889-1 [Araneus ventricosus]